MNQHRIARGLGYLSFGLAAAELFAPKRVARLTGLGDRGSLVRAFGARDLLAGAGLMVPGLRKGALWSRVVGDVLDLGTLAMGFNRQCDKTKAATAIAAVAAVFALDLYMAKTYSLWS